MEDRKTMSREAFEARRSSPRAAAFRAAARDYEAGLWDAQDPVLECAGEPQTEICMETYKGFLRAEPEAYGSPVRVYREAMKRFRSVQQMQVLAATLKSAGSWTGQQALADALEMKPNHVRGWLTGRYVMGSGKRAMLDQAIQEHGATKAAVLAFARMVRARAEGTGGNA